VGEAVPVGEPVTLGEAVPGDEAVQLGEATPRGEAVPGDEAVQVGEGTPVDGGTVTEGVSVVAVGEGAVVSVGEGVVVSVGEGVATTAATSLGPCFWGSSADRNLNTADLCGYSLRGTCEIVSTEMKRARFWGECFGRRGWIRARTAAMAVATPPIVRMTGIGRFHHGIGGGLAG
jgi:hypothetical protein